MIYFTREECDELRPFETAFTTAIKSDYILWVSVYNHKKIVAMYETRLPEKKLSHNYNCEACALGNYKRIGAKYFESVEHWKAVDETIVNTTETPSTPTVTPNKTKKTTKKSKK